MTVNRNSLVLLSLGLYVLWTAATYLLEGRVQLLLRPDPAGRAVYAVVANVVIGTLLALWILRPFLRSRLVNSDTLGFRSLHRTLIGVVVAIVVGAGLFLMQGPRSLEPIVLLNVFAQVLPTSIAEIMVCWVVVGAAAEALTRRRGRVVSLLVGIVISSVLFGVYHFAHSPPFNQIGFVAFLMVVGIGTSLVYFIGRDVYATIACHTFLGTVGIIGSADLDALRQPLYPLYFVALLGVAALIACHVMVSQVTAAIRRSATLSSPRQDHGQLPAREGGHEPRGISRGRRLTR